jgi:hypothetical protein
MSETSREPLGWAIVLAASEASAVHALRLLPGLEVNEATDRVWLRGPREPAVPEALLASLPALVRYDWMPADRLRRRSERLIVETLPAGPWQPLRSYADPAAPTLGWPAAHGRRESLSLVAATEHPSAPSNALLLTLDTWADWALTAPAARLAPLRFAVATDGHVLVLGTPVPAAPGRHATEREGVVIPAGMAWWPKISTAAVRRVCGAAPGEILLWETTGYHRLSEELFVSASRAAVRATLRQREEIART